jgi:hypothetical protein
MLHRIIKNSPIHEVVDIYRNLLHRFLVNTNLGRCRRSDHSVSMHPHILHGFVMKMHWNFIPHPPTFESCSINKRYTITIPFCSTMIVWCPIWEVVDVYRNLPLNTKKLIYDN